MAIEAVYIVLAFASFMGWLGFHKEDNWLVVFSGIIFIFLGLNILLNGFSDLDSVYAQMLGVVVIFLGAYFAIRSTVEFIQNNY
jgi:uncharacterized membrane protein HdeD (DUF308 family)